MDSQFNIPITSSIDDFLVHLKSHPRTILSAKYGDGKSYFLKELKKAHQEEYVFLTIYPINYQVENNKDIFELVKRDVLLQLIMNEMIEADYEISDSVALSFYLQHNRDEIDTQLIPFISSLFGTLDCKKALISVAALKMLRSLKKKFVEYKNRGSKEDETEKFLAEVEKMPSIECDAVTQIIRETIEKWKVKNKKRVVLVFEDMDRIDPAHLFRILNILSAHIDYCYKDGLDADDSLVGNKFGVDNTVVVLDYENLKNIFHHFYGENTCFTGYINKFASSGYYRYSFSEQRNKFIYEEISRITELPEEIIRKLLKEDRLNSREMRRIVESMRDVESQIKPQAICKTGNGKVCVCSEKMLKLYVIMRRLAISDDEIVQSAAAFAREDSNNPKYFAAYALKVSPDSPFPCTICTMDNNPDYSLYTTFESIDEKGNAKIKTSRSYSKPPKYVQYNDVAKSLLEFISK